MDWYKGKKEEIVKNLGGNIEKGLSDSQVQQRIEKYGHNELEEKAKAEKALESLQKLTSHTARVIRNGEVEVVLSSNLVPGDIVVLEVGDIVPADIRLTESSNLKIEEASLTGESVPVEKNSEDIYRKDMTLGDRGNMAYMSTIITYGRAKGMVVATGHDTEIGMNRMVKRHAIVKKLLAVETFFTASILYCLPGVNGLGYYT